MRGASALSCTPLAAHRRSPLPPGRPPTVRRHGPPSPVAHQAGGLAAAVPGAAPCAGAVAFAAAAVGDARRLPHGLVRCRSPSPFVLWRMSVCV